MVDATGIEPVTPRCHRGALPLSYASKPGLRGRRAYNGRSVRAQGVTATGQDLLPLPSGGHYTLDLRDDLTQMDGFGEHLGPGGHLFADSERYGRETGDEHDT